MSAWLGVFVPLLLAYAPTLWWCVQMWWLEDGYYSHGPLVPLLMLVVLWWRRRDWQRRPAVPDRRGFWLLLPALLLHLCGVGLTIDSLSAASLVLAVPGAAWLALGRERLRGLWPLLWLPVFAVPLPLFVSGRLAFELKEIAIAGGLWLCRLTGLGVVRDGALLHVPGQDAGLLVADPCGGLRSLLAMLLLAYVIAFVVGPAAWRRRAVLLLLSVPIALGLNAARIASVCWFAFWWGVPFASGSGHDLLNTLAWVVDLALIFGLDALLSRRGGDAVVVPAGPPLLASAVPPRRRTTLLLWGISVPLLLLGLYRPYAESMGRADRLPQLVPGFQMQRSFAISQHYYDLLGTDDAVWRSYVGSDGQPIYVVAVFHGANWKSVHPPRICLEGSDMVIAEDRLRAVEVGGEVVQAGHLLAETAAGHRPYVGYYAFGGTDMITGSYWSFFWHHAPRALFRVSNAGFLLRVESYGDGDGGRDGADRRCRELLQQLLPAAQAVLR